MKNFFRSIAVIYFAIGSLLSLPMAISYIYAQWFVVIGMGWSIFSFAGLGLIMFTGYLIVITPMIRTKKETPKTKMSEFIKYSERTYS